MKPEIILIAATLITLVINKLRKGTYEPAYAARTGMAAMLILTGIGHFLFTKGMTMMLPAFLPGKELIVYLTGIAEFSAAAGLLTDRYRTVTAWTVIAFFILITPANIYAALHHVNLQKGTYGGPGPEYLWYRLPLQLFFIACVYFSALTRNDKLANA
ncbi:Uncharacterized membrane protein [Dyadobacter soli]|uniref:Uncharacterized membrane protein n=1 Tax=Dyadobacter soli TaxID=659014 RepID=A0A1G7VK34_9BACT|nr:hypothetical protein [Dyadobacter soli]SDG60103.1 Uncharacterized membrane protein [Dyadobacter soli]